MPTQKTSLVDRVVMITGAARGIGAAGADELRRRGATVVLTDLDVDALQRTASRLGPDVVALPLDVTDAAACEAVVNEITGRFGRLDVVWANAGIASFGPLADEDPSAWTRTIEVNVLGAFHTIRAGLPSLVTSRGYLAVSASVASFAAAPGMSAYSASKSAIEAACNALRLEVAHLGVGVGSIHPTWIDTDMVREGDRELPGFSRLRAALRPPLSKTYPVDLAAKEIVDGIERRKRRICVPRSIRLVHGIRPLLTTRVFERDLLRAAPGIVADFQRSAAEEGAASISLSARAGRQQSAATAVSDAGPRT